MDSALIRNPVLPGFHPDPSIVRVGSDYYLATSSFEWWPGIPVHHSTDLVHWRLIGHLLTRPGQADLRGVPDSAGVWAPSLSHHSGQFWLVYTVVRGTGPTFKDLTNYLSTAPDILGPWSDPVALNEVGFDPSLFHDEDGRRWLVQMQWDFRPDRSSFAGIVLREYDHPRRSLVGPQHTLLRTDDLIEGPNLYRRGGWYHLMLAEGGTGWHHGIGTARARHITGPYQRDPAGPVLTARGDDSLPLQKAGHGELVCTPDGGWYLAHLASRPVHTAAGRFCVLGREACLQRVDFPMDGWLRLAGGGTTPAVSAPAPADVPAGSVHMGESTDHFDVAELDPSWSSLRVPVEESWCSLRERPGWLRLRGRDSVHSVFTQSLLAKPLPSVHCVVTTRLDFRPTRFTQCAGLICWYDTTTHYYLRITWHESTGRVLGLVYSDLGEYVEPPVWQVRVPADGDVWLRASFDGADLGFAYALDGRQWRPIGSTVDATRLSDDYGEVLRFTGAMVGLCAQDLAGAATPADFDFFTLAADPCSPAP